ncbi:MAG: glycine hydroxymethyltransferase [Chlamydiales bacterium]
MAATTTRGYLERYFDKVKESEKHKGAIAYLAALDHISETSPKIASSIIQELKAQRSNLKMIASENYSSLAVQLAMGNLLTDKYSEGYSHHRFYPGCQNVDAVEDQASEEAKKLFGCQHAYVQPHSGADANLIALWAILVNKVQDPELLKLGKKNLDSLTEQEYETIRQRMVSQKILGMSLNSGGHLTHGYRHNITGKMFSPAYYGVNDKTGNLDYQEISKIAKEVRPAILIAGFSSFPGKINFAKMREIADSVGAVLLADIAHISGLVAGKVYSNEFDPIPHAHIVTSTTHKTLRGPRGGMILCKDEFADIINKGCPLVIGGPLPHVMAAKAIAFQEANTPEFKNYAQRVVKNAQVLAETLMEQGVRVLTNGTENHQVIFDVSPYGLTGRQAESILFQAHITVNRNAIPNDRNGPWYTSGIRTGTAALTTLGMEEQEMKAIGNLIHILISNATPAVSKVNGEKSRAFADIPRDVLEKVQKEIKEILKGFPLYPEIVMIEED